MFPGGLHEKREWVGHTFLLSLSMTVDVTWPAASCSSPLDFPHWGPWPRTKSPLSRLLWGTLSEQQDHTRTVGRFLLPPITSSTLSYSSFRLQKLPQWMTLQTLTRSAASVTSGQETLSLHPSSHCVRNSGGGSQQSEVLSPPGHSDTQFWEP